MKSILIPTFALVSSAVALAADPPKALGEFLTPNALVKAEIVVVVPPQDLDKYVAKVEEAARKDPEWFAEHSKKAKPSVPLPYDERLGLTKEEYDEYLKLWAQREFKPVKAEVLQLKEGKDGSWSINATGEATLISLLKYDPKGDTFRSMNGDLKRIDDVNADPNSTLGAWTGHEWKLELSDTLGKTKENIAVGKTGDGKYGLIVYRMQEVSEQGTRLADKGMVIRFLLGEAGLLKERPAGGQTAPATAPAPTKKPAESTGKKKK